MRKLILAWLLAAASVGGCVTYYNRTTPDHPVPLTPFEEVCALVEEEYETTCEGVLEPILVVTELVDEFGAQGVYVHGESYIFVSPTGDHMEDTIVHETVHYVLWELGLARERCESEDLAREWTAIILGNEVDPTWRLRYGC